MLLARSLAIGEILSRGRNEEFLPVVVVGGEVEEGRCKKEMASAGQPSKNGVNPSDRLTEYALRAGRRPVRTRTRDNG